MSLHLVTDRDEWLEWRRGGIGGSDIAGILGLSPWESPWSIWANKVGLIPDHDFSNESMEFGMRAEPMLKGYFEERTGLWVIGEQERCQNPDMPHFRCTVDGAAEEAHSGSDDGSAELAKVEFKCTADPPEVWAERVPTHYACQATWISIVTGTPMVLFGVLHLAYGRPKFRVYQFTPAADDMALLVAKASAFWHGHVVTGIAPDVDATDATTHALREAYPGDVNLDEVEADKGLLMCRDRIVANKQRVTDARKVVTENENVIKAALGDRTTLVDGLDDRGRPIVVATWKPQHRSGYVVEDTVTRPLLIKTPKEKP